LLHIITSTGDGFLDLSTSMILNDLEPPKEGFHWIFSTIFGCSAHFNSEWRRNGWR